MAIGGLIGLVGAAGWLLISGSGSTSRPTASIAVTTTRHVAEPAGNTPSKSAQMVCAPEAQKDIAKFLGQPTTAVTTPTWLDHLYSCRYAYANGVIGLSVKELSNKSQTSAYFSSMQGQFGQQEKLKGFGQGAFVTTNGSLVLRKDYKVLVVDTSGLPSQFGSPAQAKKDVAIGVALTVLGCWTGA
jgi:hypothetical protein